VWRKACIDSAGGWNARTLVEDMDLSLRAFLKGWHFVWRYDMECPNEIPSDYGAYRKQQRRWSCGPMQLWAAARQSVTESTLPPLHKAYLNIFFFGVRMLATNVISFTFYSVLVPMILLVYATEDPEAAVHHRFMPWWAIVWLPLLVTMTTMAFSPGSFHYMILYVMYENAMSILKLGASLEGLLGLKGAMTWTVTQKLGKRTENSCDMDKILKKLAVFPRELCVGFFLIGAAVYGYNVGASWVFTVYFSTQGFIFLIFSLSLVEAFNLQPPSEAKLLGLEEPEPGEEMQPITEPTPKKKKPKKKGGRKARAAKGAPAGRRPLSMDDDDDDVDEEEEEEDDDDDDEEALRGGASLPRRKAPRGPPSLLAVLRANVIIFLYTLPINAFSILLLYGVTTMALSEFINAQWDDVIALGLALFVIPLHMFWCLGHPSDNWRHRKLARVGRLPLSTRLKQFAQLQLLYFYLLLLLLISMYSASATLQDYVSRECFQMTGKWLEEYIDRRRR